MTEAELVAETSNACIRTRELWILHFIFRNSEVRKILSRTQCRVSSSSNFGTGIRPSQANYFNPFPINILIPNLIIYLFLIAKDWY